MAATVYALGEKFDIAEQEQTGKPLSPEELIAKIAALVYEYKLTLNTTSQVENEIPQSAIISLLTAELLEVPSRYRLLQINTNQPIDWQNCALLFGGELPQIKTRKKKKRKL